MQFQLTGRRGGSFRQPSTLSEEPSTHRVCVGFCSWSSLLFIFCSVSRCRYGNAVVDALICVVRCYKIYIIVYISLLTTCIRFGPPIISTGLGLGLLHTIHHVSKRTMHVHTIRFIDGNGIDLLYSFVRYVLINYFNNLIFYNLKKKTVILLFKLADIGFVFSQHRQMLPFSTRPCR